MSSFIFKARLRSPCSNELISTKYILWHMSSFEAYWKYQCSLFTFDVENKNLRANLKRFTLKPRKYRRFPVVLCQDTVCSAFILFERPLYIIEPCKITLLSCHLWKWTFVHLNVMLPQGLCLISTNPSVVETCFFSLVGQNSQPHVRFFMFLQVVGQNIHISTTL